MREAFEKAILDAPDEVTAYAAYADWLQEQDDPRGEFMRVQLALENEGTSAAERKKLRAREKALLKNHEREWLGELARFLIDQEGLGEDETPIEYAWSRGFLSKLTAYRLSTAQAHALADSPAARFLSELWVHDTVVKYGDTDPSQPPFRRPTPAGVREHWELLELIDAPCLQHLRVFRMGYEEPHEDSWCDCNCYVQGVEHVIASMPRVEELHLLCKGYESGRLFALPNLGRLRVLRMYHLGGRGWRGREPSPVYALNVLAANPAFGRLTHLLFHPHQSEGTDAEGRDLCYLPLDQVRALVNSPHLKKLTHLQLRLSDMGDDGVRAIIASGILKRLRWLDLRHGCVTDEGARLLAECPDTINLERLDLSRNAVSAEGLKTLRKATINAVANLPLTEQELADREYLREGDFE